MLARSFFIRLSFIQATQPIHWCRCRCRFRRQIIQTHRFSSLNRSYLLLLNKNHCTISAEPVNVNQFNVHHTIDLMLVVGHHWASYYYWCHSNWSLYAHNTQAKGMCGGSESDSIDFISRDLSLNICFEQFMSRCNRNNLHIYLDEMLIGNTAARRLWLHFMRPEQWRIIYKQSHAENGASLGLTNMANFS